MRKPTGVRALVRYSHRDRILLALRERGALSRADLSELLGISRTTLSGVIAELLAVEAIVVTETDAAQREGSGRPAELLALDPGAGQLMGVDFAHRGLRVVIADASHEIIARGQQSYADDGDWQARIRIAFALIDDITATSRVHVSALQGIGIGVPGPVVAAELPVGAPEHLFHPGHLLAEAFQERFNAPALLDNNVRLAALAEAMSTSGGDNVLYARISDGIGGGVIVGGRLVTGASGLAGEVGHARAVLVGGLPCRCGKEGCLETVASVPAILSECDRRGVPMPDLNALAKQVHRRNPIVDEVLRTAGTALGRALATVAMVMDPAQVIIGGEIVRLAPTLTKAAEDVFHFDMATDNGFMPHFRQADLDDDAGAIGAVAVLFHGSPQLAGPPPFPHPLQSRPPIERKNHVNRPVPIPTVRESGAGR